MLKFWSVLVVVVAAVRFPSIRLKPYGKNYGLRKKVQLRVTECLGPCDMHNVAMLMTEGEQVWIGKLKEQAHFEAIAEWASNVIQIGSGAKLPEILEPHCFECWESDNQEYTLVDSHLSKTIIPQLTIEG